MSGTLGKLFAHLRAFPSALLPPPSSLVAIALLATVSRTLAVSTAHWTQNSQAEFQKGTFHNVVVTSLGDLKLSRSVKTLLQEDPRVDSVYCMAEAPDGTVYAGTAPHGLVLAIKDQTVSTVANFGDACIISALMFDKDHHLLVGLSGEAGKIYRIDSPTPGTARAATTKAAKGAKPVDRPVEKAPVLGNAAKAPPASAPAAGIGDEEAADVAEKAKEIFSAEGVQYIWAMLQTPDGLLYVATGPNGQLFQIDAAGKSSVLFDSDETNLLSMVSDGKDLLYIGCDPDGLIYRVNRKTKDVYAMFQASEAEISCLALDAKGNLYAATAESSDQPPRAEENESKENQGRPEPATAPAIPSSAPSVPPSATEPAPPAEPNPIPRVKPRQTRLDMRQLDGLVGFAPTGTLFFEDPQADPTQPGPSAPKKEPRIIGPTTGPAPAPPGPQAQVEQPKPNGNAIYRIDPRGFVTEIFRQPVLIYSMIEHDGVILAGTGGEGLIYQIKPDKEETTVLARVDPKQVTCLFPASDGGILIGTSNAGGIAVMGAGPAASGTFTSQPLDAAQISRFGKVHLHGSLPPGSTLTLATRSGNIHDPAKAGWSVWSDEVPATEYTAVSSPAARFLQYRLTFTSNDAKATPIVNEVTTAYQMPNLAPLVKGIKIASANPEAAEGKMSPPVPGAPAPGGTRTLAIAWDAEDPNGDALQFTLYFRTGSTSPWILLKDKLSDNHFEWDTRNVADGRYEIKVVASDALANPAGEGLTASRVSEAVTVDNTPPVITDAKATVNGRTVMIEARLADQTSSLASAAYGVDANEDWQSVLPSDRIFDSPEAKVSFSVSNLAPGPHQITLRATDSKGNQAFKTLLVTIEAPAEKR